MDVIKYIVLGIIQGITEPIPVSSSGHVMLFKAILNTNIFNSLNFEIISNFGSFIAIFIIFFEDIFKIMKGFIKHIISKEKCINNKLAFDLLLKIIVSTIPVGITGIIFKDLVEKAVNIYYLSLMFLLTSLLIFLVKNKEGKKSLNQISYKDAIKIGLFQAITILPGISRSGTVLVACLFCGLTKKDALKYTFLLYFPVSIATIALELKGFILTPNFNIMAIPYLAGTISSFIVTFFSYKWMAKLVIKGKLVYFAYYCLFIAAFIIIYFH